MQEVQKKKGFLRSLFGDLLFAVIVATMVGALFVKAYAIPTPSMEGTLMVGDHMFVSKLHYGSRLPETPLQVPLTHQKIWGTDIPAYLNWVQLPYFRLPGLGKVEANDIVVFNYPAEHAIYPTDLRTYYVKRCVGLPGDTIQIVDQHVLINKHPLPETGEMQSSYFVQSSTDIRDRVFLKNDINDFHKTSGGYVVNASAKSIEQLKSFSFVQNITKILYPENENIEGMFGDVDYHWNIDQFGPLYIPKKGGIIDLTSLNVSIYGELICDFERNENISIHDGQLIENGVKLAQYQFKQDYYFMMGDNRHNSEDSRFWGFVPEDHIVGKPLFVYWSVTDNPNESYFSNIRWDRFLKWVGNS
jgi:signal peptidase I